MKTLLVVGAGVLLLSTLAGCVVAPYPEPVVHVPPAAAVVVRPGYGHHHHYRPHWRRWR
jgi:hypothetical protein